jgi:hypothetical protein
MEIALLALIPALVVTALVLWILWKALKGVLWLLGKLFRAIGAVLGGLFGFVKREIGETARVAGALVSGALLVPVAILSAIFGRMEAARHFGRALEDELVNVLLGVWRIGVAHPLRLLGLSGALEGVEGRIPDVFERAPRSAARARAGALGFPGYEVLGSLPGGGSGAQLFLARPLAAAHPRARELPAEVVIKSFALVQGSTLPQIVRESRALEAAGRLGLVLEHHLDEGRFWYVMRYVRGENLDTAVQRLHARSGVEGLGRAELALVLGYAQDLVRSLERFHAGGLWHKDVKPANLIVAGERAHLVDFGLVTPLASALTLTTHGTEYYRDPELVRLAMQGVKVHEVDGVKFDLYSAGAVLYTMVENSFPAHGSLSRLTKRCPEALTWIQRRAMAEIGTRYASAREMLADLAALASAADPFALAPADLPSVRGGPIPPVEPVEPFVSRDPIAEPPVSELRGARDAGALESPAPSRPRSRFCVDTTRPVTSGARRFRRFLVAAAVVLGGLAVTRAIAERRAFVAPAEVLVPHVTRLDPEERHAYDVARKVLRSAELEAPAAALAMAWNERLARLAPERAGARALVLESPVNPLVPDERLALMRALTAKGFAVLGTGEDAPVEPDELDLVGGARLAAGLGSPADDEALGRVQRYLEGVRAIDALVWVASEPGAGTIVRVLTRQAPRASETAALESSPARTSRLSRRAR